MRMTSRELSMKRRGLIPNSNEHTKMAPSVPSVSANMLSSGMTIIAAATRGKTSFFTGSPPSARMASTCSVTFMAPTSAAIPLPMRPPTMTAVSVGPSSRRNESTMTRGMYSTPPNFRRP